MSPEEVEAIEVRLVLEAIHARYGYDFRDYSAASIQRRVKAALAKTGTPNFGELLHRLLTDPTFFTSVLSCLTVQVTEMFRDPEFFATFRRDVVPLLRTYPQLKIWHAGCASGEEAYTTAILLLEEKLYDRTQIYATDIDASAIERAKEGIYAEGDVAQYSRNYDLSGGKRSFHDYCTRAYSRMSINQAVRDNIVFFQHDLTSDFALGEMNVIFCRNVTLYFTEPLRNRVFDVFAKGLCRGGFLCLGSSESLPTSARNRFIDFVARQRIYRFQGDT